MAATSEYPSRGSALVRGDPVEIPVNITQDGVAIDVSGFTWRAQIRTAIDGSLVDSFATQVITPAGGSVPSTVLLTLTPAKSQNLITGMVFDLEQLDGVGTTIRTWWICTRINVQKDVSNSAP